MYRRLFDEVVSDKYRTHTLHESFIEGATHPDKVNGVFRFDVGFGYSEYLPLTEMLCDLPIDGLFYFVTY